MLKGVRLVVSSSRLSGNAILSALPALRSSLIDILTILSLNEKSPNVFCGVRRYLSNDYWLKLRFEKTEQFLAGIK